MNILDFMKHKHEVIFVYDCDTVEHAINLLSKERFTSIPILSKEEKYVGTISEGDLLYVLYEFGRKGSANLKISEIHRHRDYQPVRITDPVVALIARASNENFVPVVDDADRFLGIVTRKRLLDYFFETKFVIL